MSLRKVRIVGHVRSLRLPALAVLACAGTLFGQSTLVTDSPFAPIGSATAAGNAPAESYELAGSSEQGSAVSVCIFERQKKHSQWIPVGGDLDGIHVISFDASRDTAVVTIAGARKELSMRKSVIASANSYASGRMPVALNAPGPSTGPIASAPVQAAPAAIQDQKEARMLVSDLLEIGVQQRKAYQDAKLKAAQGSQPSQGN
jgi:hypothetical protein